MQRKLLPTLLRITLLLALSLTVLPLTRTHAQSDPPPDYVLKAMANLSVVLGQEVTPQNSFYDWVERIYNDASLDCPAEGQAYTQQTIRGYDVDIQFPLDGPEYNYRVSADGLIVILCVNGRPDPRSVGITVPPGVSTPAVGTVNAPTTVKELSQAQWYAWVYQYGETEQLILLNPNGEQARIARPKLPNEIAEEGYSPQVTFSRDGRYMLIAARVQGGVEAIGLYSLATATFISVYQAGPGEEIHLGARYGAVVKSPYVFNPASSQYVVGFYTGFGLANAGWKMVVFDTATGNALYQLLYSPPAVTTLAGQLPSIAAPAGTFFPMTVYFGNDSIHFQLTPAGTEGGPTLDTLNWHPNANAVEVSAYNHTTQDVLPTNEAVLFPHENAAAPVLPANGPFTSFNSVAQTTSAGTEILLTDATKYHFDTKWASNGALAMFASSGEDFATTWNALAMSNRTITPLPNTILDVLGTPTGFLSVNADGVVSSHLTANPAAGTILWQPVQPQEVQLAWVTPPGSLFALTEITLPGNVGGAVVCPDTPPTRMAVGGRGQVAFTDGQPLRVRDTPNGAFLLEMPEGTQFIVIGGPDCTGGRYTWYQIQLTNGTIGWSAEGDLEGYFMEPIN
ncbi:MAG: SH3 domain-containing protein [Chloroflexi bacterium]|nr:SH3 domain-containing protein [Chloroflexota bacterium]NOG63864.1 SH3 domain-containing protein [Chloroflexota bacterium]